jgi:hypothetical protein
MKICLSKPKKIIMMVTLMIITIVIVIGVVYTVLFYSKNKTCVEDEIINNSVLQYSDQYLSFDYPINFIYSIETEKIPADNDRNINITHIDDQDAIDPFRVLIDIYNNPKDLTVEKYIEYQAQQGVMMLPEEVDSYLVSTKEVEVNSIIEYLSKRTDERNTFIGKQGKIVSIQQFGNSELIREAYSLVLKTIHVK